jgi:hypothetical protein
VKRADVQEDLLRQRLDLRAVDTSVAVGVVLPNHLVEPLVDRVGAATGLELEHLVRILRRDLRPQLSEPVEGLAVFARVRRARWPTWRAK